MLQASAGEDRVVIIRMEDHKLEGRQILTAAGGPLLDGAKSFPFGPIGPITVKPSAS